MSADIAAGSQKRFRCLLLDLDGTLADTAPDMGASLNRLLIRNGRLPLSFAEMRPLVSNGSWAMIRAGFGLEKDDPGADELRQDFLDDYVENVHEHTTLFPGFDQLLTDMQSVGLPWGIMTNKPSRYTNPLVRSMGLDKRAACIISADEVPQAKPAADGIIAAVDAAKVTPAQSIYVGDSIRDVQAAHAAGVFAVGVTWGYIERDDDPHAWNADAVIDRPAELYQYLDLPAASRTP